MTDNSIAIDLQNIDEELIARLSVLMKRAKANELYNIVLDGGIEEILLSLGIDELLDDYARSLTVSAMTKVGGFAKLKQVEKQIDNIAMVTENISNVYRDQILGHFQANAAKLKGELLNGLTAGMQPKQILGNLFDPELGTFITKAQGTSHILTEANVMTIIDTSYSNVTRVGVAQAFADNPEQKFEYVGGVIPTSSPQCRELMETQKPGGYTKAEIDAGIETSHGIINWFGRQPNYNCIHEWLPVYED